MAEFGANITDAPETSSHSTVKQGVTSVIEKEPVLLKGLTDIFETVDKGLKSKKEKQNNALINEFTTKQLTLIQAIDQGKLPSQFARTQLRKNLIEAVGNFPGLRDEILKVNGQIAGAAGFGAIINDGTEEEQRRNKLDDKLVQDGLVRSDASENEFSQARANFMLAEETARRTKAEMETISLQRATIGLSKDQLDLLDKKEQRIAGTYLTNTMPASVDAFNTYVDQVLTDPDLTESEKVNLIEDRFSEIEVEAAPWIARAGGHQGEALTKVFAQRRDLALQRATGELTDAEAKRKAERLVQTQELLALQDPALARMVAVSNLAPDILVGLQLDAARVVSDFIDKNGTPPDEDPTSANLFTDTPTGKQASEAYFRALIDNQDVDPAATEEIATNLENIFNGIEDYQGVLARNPKAGITMTNWMASDAFYKLRQSNPEAFTNVSVATEVLQSHYADEVWGMVKREFTNAKVMDRNVFLERRKAEASALLKGQGKAADNNPEGVTLPTMGLVTYRPSADGVEFMATDTENPLAVKEAQRLNRELKPVINKTVKAFAHLEGHQNYERIFANAAESIFNIKGQAAGGDVEDDLNIKDFLTGLDSVDTLSDEEVIDFAGKISGPGFETSRKMKSVDGMIIHHTAGREASPEHLVNVLNERGLSVQYFIDRNGRVAKLMEDDSVALHAGKNNKSGFNNSNTIGVEIAGLDDSDITPQQVMAAKRLIKTLSAKYGFDPSANVFGHGEVATHKQKTEGQKVVSALRQ